MTKFKEFRIGDLFDIHTGARIKPVKLIPGNVARISVKNTNNGIYGYFKTNCMNDVEHFTNFISVNFFGHAYYHSCKASVEMKVHVLQLKDRLLTESIGLYLVTALNVLLKDKYGYGNQLSSSKLKRNDLNIVLPVNSDNEPDWNYMDKYIQEIQAKYLREKQAEYDHRVATFDDVIGDDKLDEQECQAVLDRYQKAQFGKFRIGDLFDITTSKGRYNANRLIIQDHKDSAQWHPYIVRTSYNNGIKGYIQQDESTLNDGNTISLAQDTAEFFYQSEPYFTGDKIKVLSLKEETLNDNLAQYLITAIYKSFQIFTWGSTSFSVQTVSNVELVLPLNDDGLINYDLMNDYIKVIKMIYLTNFDSQLANRLNIAKTLI